MSRLMLVHTCKECGWAEFHPILPEHPEIYECEKCGYPNTVSDMGTKELSLDSMSKEEPKATGKLIDKGTSRVTDREYKFRNYKTTLGKIVDHLELGEVSGFAQADIADIINSLIEEIEAKGSARVPDSYSKIIAVLAAGSVDRCHQFLSRVAGSRKESFIFATRIEDIRGVSRETPVILLGILPYDLEREVFRRFSNIRRFEL